MSLYTFFMGHTVDLIRFSRLSHESPFRQSRMGNLRFESVYLALEILRDVDDKISLTIYILLVNCILHLMHDYLPLIFSNIYILPLINTLLSVNLLYLSMRHCWIYSNSMFRIWFLFTHTDTQASQGIFSIIFL